MTKDSLLELLRDFHFDALTKEPFLCVHDNDYALYYTFKHEEYGKLSRVFLASNPLEVKNFLALYKFYLEHENDISISLDNYKEISPKVSFWFRGNEIYSDEISKIEKVLSSSYEDEVYLQKVRRTVLLLQDIIVAKVKLQRDCHDSVLRFSKEYDVLLKKIDEKILKYDSKYKKDDVESIANEVFYDFTLDYLEIKIDDVSKISLDELKVYLQKLISLLRKIDESDTFIQDKYELLCYPLKIDLAGKKLDYIEKLLTKKGRLFSKKVNLEHELLEMEKSHSLYNIISFPQYKKNELKRIQEKYVMTSDIDIRTIGDFFIEFDNLKIKDVKITVKKSTPKLDSKLIISALDNAFDARTLEEQASLVLHHSIIKPICYYLETKQDSLANDYIKDLISDLKLSANSMIFLRYFKSLSISSVDEFKKSLLRALNKINDIDCDELLGDIILYFKDGKKISNKRYLEASDKIHLAPCQNLGEQEVIYIASLKKGSQVYYIPREICYDVESDDVLTLKSGKPFFLIDTKKNDIKEKNSDIITVVEYKGEKKIQKDYVLVDNIKSVKINRFKKVFIERNEK